MASIHERAIDDLAYIRSTMTRSATFTALPGRGGMLMGLVGAAGAIIAWRQTDPASWLTVWLATGALGFLLAVVFITRKAHRAGVPILDGPGRKFALALLPPLVVGAVLTRPLFDAGQANMLPAVWLMLYGIAVLAAGVFSVRLVPVLGTLFLLLGLAALAAPPGTGDIFMALGFGGLHLIFGFLVARRYGG